MEREVHEDNHFRHKLSRLQPKATTLVRFHIFRSTRQLCHLVNSCPTEGTVLPEYTLFLPVNRTPEHNQVRSAKAWPANSR
jgi:hypothetical protein